jgi:hypothetical protein
LQWADQNVSFHGKEIELGRHHHLIKTKMK